jgi:membrane protein DedA with SNARE-associated domain
VCLGFWFGDDIERAAREATRFGHYILLAVGVVLAALAVRYLQRRRASQARAEAQPSQATER